MTDNIHPDRDPVTGKHFVVLPALGWYVLCQIEAPYGYDAPKANTGCSTVAFSPKVGLPLNGGAFVNTPWPVPRQADIGRTYRVHGSAPNTEAHPSIIADAFVGRLRIA